MANHERHANVNSSQQGGESVGPPENAFEDDTLHRSTTKRLGLLKLRTDHDTEHQDWWFASIAIPLLAATIAPLANVLSIAALVSPWRTDLAGPNGKILAPLNGRDVKDPSWVYGLNLASLICGYVGNLFLLMNFTNRIRYIIALPVTILLWYISTALLIGIQVSMNTYVPPDDHQTYSQAFWYGVIAAALYLICSMILMVNMVGYFLGHYPQQFNLTDSQRTLILQTFLFFIWLAGGAGVYAKIETTYGDQSWSFSDALYFCDVTILTVGFGDLVPTDALGRGLLLPYSVGGIIMLGLVISSITTFATEISHANIMRKRANRQRLQTLARSASVSERHTVRQSLAGLKISRLEEAEETSAANLDGSQPSKQPLERNSKNIFQTIKRQSTRIFHGRNIDDKSHRRPRGSIAQLKEEKGRFDAMRRIQKNNASFKRWSSLVLSSSFLFILWFIGAVVFWQVEGKAQQMTYFDAIYFCFVSLITIGYGDFAPVTNAGRPFFVVWSLLAVPSITILISNMADTVISGFKNSMDHLASFTLLPQYGIWRTFLNNHPWLLWKIEQYEERKDAEKRVLAGFEAGQDSENDSSTTKSPGALHKPKTVDQIAHEMDSPMDEHDLAAKISAAIRRTADDFRKNPKRRYEYEEWVEYTQLIRYTKGGDDEMEEMEEEGLIEWDWIGEDSPMMTEQTEPEWLLHRLCESMSRYARRRRRLDKPSRRDDTPISRNSAVRRSHEGLFDELGESADVNKKRSGDGEHVET